MTDDHNDNYWEGFLTGAVCISLIWALVWFADLMSRGIR